MDKKLIRLSSMFICFSLVIVVFCVAFCFIASDNETTQIHFDQVSEFDSAWTYNGESTVSLPYAIDGVKDQVYIISNQIPEYITSTYAIDISSNYCYNEIVIDGEVRYTYGSKQVLSFGHMVGNIKCIVPLTQEDAGKAIEIRIIPMYSQDYQIPVVYVGTQNAITSHVLLDNLWKIVFCSILAIFMIISAFMGIRQYISHVNSGRRMLLNFSMFTAAACSWIICSSDIPQLITNANEAVSFASYLSLAFIGAPFMAFCSEIFPSGKIHFNCMSILGCINTVAIILLFMAGLLDPPQTLLSTHIYFVLLVFSDLFFSIIEGRKKSYLLRWMEICNFVVLLFMSLGLLFYYTNPTSGYDSIFFSMGFALFITMLFSMLVHMQINTTKEATEIEVFKKLAYSDTMTNMANRAAFDEQFDRIADGNYKSEEAGSIIVFDVNNLKEANDQFGHHVGDELIKGTAYCINIIFSSIGSTYRMGGDEFAVIILHKVDMDVLLFDFDRCIKKYNEENGMAISVAKGYCEFSPKDITAEKLRAVLQEADKLMYQDKENIKRLSI